jgi:hypothetical protein
VLRDIGLQDLNVEEAGRRTSQNCRQNMDQISIKTPNPKGRLFFKIDLLRDLAAGVYLSEAPSPPLLGFCLGWSSNFVCSESGQIQSV